MLFQIDPEIIGLFGLEYSRRKHAFLQDRGILPALVAGILGGQKLLD